MVVTILTLIFIYNSIVVFSSLLQLFCLSLPVLSSLTSSFIAPLQLFKLLHHFLQWFLFLLLAYIIKTLFHWFCQASTASSFASYFYTLSHHVIRNSHPCISLCELVVNAQVLVETTFQRFLAKRYLNLFVII